VVAGLLLTGGRSRRLGTDKALVRRDGETLAARGARVLAAVCDPAVEVGPGVSGLPTVREEPVGSGPLAALVAGAAAVAARGERAGAVLLAVDLPFVEPPLLRLLIDLHHESDADAVVPRAAGVLQPTCAVYGPDALVRAADLVAPGDRSLRSLLDAIAVRVVDEGEWRAVAAHRALDDVDTPGDLTRLGLTADPHR
jgi:molybdenum cofactor guanylyltransferase